MSNIKLCPVKLNPQDPSVYDDEFVVIQDDNPRRILAFSFVAIGILANWFLQSAF